MTTNLGAPSICLAKLVRSYRRRECLTTGLLPIAALTLTVALDTIEPNRIYERLQAYFKKNQQASCFVISCRNGFDNSSPMVFLSHVIEISQTGTISIEEWSLHYYKVFEWTEVNL